jgi:hypothetical protein
MPRLPPVTTATLLENSPATIESSVIACPLETSFDVIKEGRLIRYILGLPSCRFTSAWLSMVAGKRLKHRS